MTATGNRWALFGGSFDPPHIAHVLSVAVALSSGEVDRVLAVPCFHHAFGKDSVSFDHRVAMAEVAFALFGDRVTVSRIEERLGRPSRTLRTLEALQQEHPEVAWRLLIGTDILAETAKWHRFDEVSRLAPPLLVGRSGYRQQADTDFELPAVSSTLVRSRLAVAESAGHLVPATVREYIDEHGLYRNEESP